MIQQGVAVFKQVLINFVRKGLNKVTGEKINSPAVA